MAETIKRRIDLQGVACPMNFLKAKLALEELDSGERMEVILDEGEAMINVSRSLKDDGHKIIKVDPLGKTFRVIIEKG